MDDIPFSGYLETGLGYVIILLTGIFVYATVWNFLVNFLLKKRLKHEKAKDIEESYFRKEET